jgi:NADH:ubiquinone oxidoreductase subunit F (NADH-binding)/NADH:ubiquinone oxidoreductase subunit E/NAD-dependent dihydropyrimidine dehydrogenase PreA subunit
MQVEIKDIDRIISEKGASADAVIPILQGIQEIYNYLPETALRRVCEKTEITNSQIIGVASFYSQFRFTPAGKHMIKVCLGTACHVKGAQLVHDAFRRELKIDESGDTTANGDYTVEKVNCLGCCTLAPVVQIDNVTYGHVSTDQVTEVIRDFESQDTDGSKPVFKRADGSEIEGEIRIGLGSCCVASGSDEIRDAVKKSINKNNLNVKLKHVGCVGMCHQVPLVEIVPNAEEPTLYTKVLPKDVNTLIKKHFKAPGLFKRLGTNIFDLIENIQDDSSWGVLERYNPDYREKHINQFLGNQIPIATEYRGEINPGDLQEYINKQGFLALKRCINTLSSPEVIEIIQNSGIKGRGGAGFPTGRKWELVAREESSTKYVICNGDEGDPGAFMDRMLLESYPFRIIEGMLIAGYAVGANSGIFYIRAEYPLAVARVQDAINKCKEAGFIGKNILGTDFSFDITIYEGAGAFVCGEETALISSIEGKRGFPTIRPPYPASEGLWGHPTLVNNTETLALIAYIIKNGWQHFSDIGSKDSKGTKVFSLAGKIERGGLIEVPMGISIREIIEEIGGGVPDGHKFKAVQIGGPSGGCVPSWKADIPIDFESLIGVGAMMGSGGLVVLDDSDCMVDIARYFLSFTQNESCGKCTFCRVGTKRMLDILNKICEGKGTEKDLLDLEELADWTKKGSLCGLGKTAPNPVLSTLKFFRNEYESHINGKCPTGKCKSLISYKVTDDCIGCTKCAQMCPVDAIAFTPHEKHEIDLEKCIKCDSCRAVCPVDAVITV